MKLLTPLLLATWIAGSLCACNPGTSVSTNTGHVTSDGKRITLRADGQPDAEISPAGDFSIDGKVQSVTPAQRLLLQAYHTEMNAMTRDGIAIGKQGAALAGKAVSEVIKGAINGDSDQIDAKVEAEARKIEKQALQICKRLATIKVAQDSLAAQLSSFRPYATIDMDDVDDCHSDNDDSEAVDKKVATSSAAAVEQDPDTVSNNAAARADAAATASGR